MLAPVAVRQVVRGQPKDVGALIAAAHTSAIRTATNAMKVQGRRQMERAGLGKKLPNAFRGEVRSTSGRDITKRGTANDPQGKVFSRSFVKGRAGGVFDLIETFERGVTIQGTPYLAIPSQAAGGRRAKSPQDYPAGTFRTIPVKRGRGRPTANAAAFYLIHKVRKELWYTLVKNVKLRKRLRLGPLYDRQVARVPDLIESSFRRQIGRMGR